MDSPRPPRLASRLLALLSRSEDRPSVLGDYEEIFADVARDLGPAAGRRWYRSQVWRSLPMLLKGRVCGTASMIKSYATIARRNILKHKGDSVINILGLSLGLAVCSLIVLWVKSELSYDRFHVRGDRICRTVWDARFGNNAWKSPLVDVPLGPALLKEFPEVEAAVRFRQGGLTLRFEDSDFRENRVLFADESFFRVFTVAFISGDPDVALRDPDAVVLTEPTARRYFRDRDPVGQTLLTGDGRLLRVTGVVRPFPESSHFHFDLLGSLLSLPIVQQREGRWGSGTVYTYLVLRPGQTPAGLEAKLQAYIDTNVATGDSRAEGDYWRYELQPLQDIHLRSHLPYELEANGATEYVYLFSAVALFILLLACINYVNLATARSMARAREVGIRKVLGSDRRQLLRQFLTESLLQVVAAVILAALLARLALPLFNRMAGRPMSAGLFLSPFAFAALAAMTFVVTLAAGAYPAFFLASLPAARVIKDRAASRAGRARLRQVLVIAQFCVSVGLVAGTLVIRGQLRYVQSTRLGFDKERVVVVQRAGVLGEQIGAFRDRLRSLPRVEEATSAQNFPGQTFDSMGFEIEQPANYRQTSLTYAVVDEYYVDALRLNIVSGRNFRPGSAPDAAAYLINQAAARALGWTEPLGKRLYTGQGEWGPVIGVVEDFHIESLRHAVKPLVLMINRWRPSYVAVRLGPGDLREGLALVRQTWSEFAPRQPFEYSFLDDDYKALYRGEERVGRLFIAFSALAIVVASLGLLGLASIVAVQRTREIGLRKVLGASVPGVVGMLTKDFVKLVLLADVIAGPVTYFVMDRWLRGFAYHILAAWWMFAVPAALALGLALLTVSAQSVKAALADPAATLRYE